MDWASEAGIKSDGIVLQNTVYTPNHAYVACDVDASQGTIGAGPPDEVIFDWYYPDNFNAYQVLDAGGRAARSPCATGPARPIDGHPGHAAGARPGAGRGPAAKVAGEPGIVLHDVARFGEFRKTIRLDGRGVHVGYQGTKPGHRVANEFCVDLHAAALQGRRQAAAVSADRRTATVRQAGTPHSWEQHPPAARAARRCRCGSAPGASSPRRPWPRPSHRPWRSCGCTG